MHPRLFAIAALWAGICIAGVPTAAAQSDAEPMPVSQELMPYLHVRSVIEFSPAELVELIPELKDVEFEESQELLPSLLEKVGENVELFFKDYPNTSALEKVYMERVEPGGVTNQYRKHEYHYIITAIDSKDEIGLEEYRASLKDERLDARELQGAYFLTSGHASAVLHFHPRLQAGCRFRYLGREKKKPHAYVIAFAQNPEKTKTYGMINLLGKDVAILKQGAVWVDPESWQILRMRSELLAPRPDVDLEAHTSIIEFSEVRFDGLSRTLWLPKELELILKFRGYEFRNRHRYSDYHLFSVRSIEGPRKVAPKVPPDPE